MPGILAKKTLTSSRGKRTRDNFWLQYGRLRGDAGSLADTLMMTVKPASIRKSSPLQNPSLVSFGNCFLRCLLDSSSMKPAAARSPHGLRRTYFWQRLFETNRKHDAHIPYTAPCMRSSILTQDWEWRGSHQRSLLFTKSSRGRWVLDARTFPGTPASAD